MVDAEEGDVAAIFARLKQEIRSGSPGRSVGGPGSSDYLSPEARLRAERTWSVSAERPFQSPPEQGLVRRALADPTKRLLRKLMRWYVEPLAAEQRSFNLAVLTLVDDLAARIESDVKRLERRIEAIEESSGAGAGPRP
jgi:hypothetical protein